MHRILGYNCVKTICKKNSALWFFLKRNFEKNAIFDCFSSSIPYFSEPRPDTGFMVSYNIQAFHRLHFHLKMASKNFFRLRFLGRKRDLKKFRNFFFICSSYFSKLTKDTEIILPQDKQQGYRFFCTTQVFVIKYDAFGFLPKIHFFISLFKKISFIFLAFIKVSSSEIG